MTNIANQPWRLVPFVQMFRTGITPKYVGLIAYPISHEGPEHTICWDEYSTGYTLAGCLRRLADAIAGTTTVNEAKYRVDTRFPDGTWRPHSHNLRLSRAIGLMTAYHGEPWPCRVVNAQGNPVAYGPPPGEPDFVARGVADMRGDET